MSGLVKLKIAGVEKLSSAPGGGVDVMINPESIKHNRTITVGEKNVGNTSAPVTDFQSMGPETLEFSLELENTGAHDHKGSSKDVFTVIENIAAQVYKYDAGLHKPKYAVVSYGKITFKGMCESFNVDYKMFDMAGTPTRATLSLKFKGINEPNKSNQSPDMTHGRTIREGDSLPLICKEIYGKTEYYVAVAEHNGLTNFRDLEIGSVLEFPPLER